MARERALKAQSSKTKHSSLVNITVLVVDDDPICLAIVAAMLRECNYQVETAKDPIEALSTLREGRGLFDLVLTDLHIPQMNGLELQRRIDAEFKVPVIIMSSDDKESLVVQSLTNGAMLFIVKPINQDDLKNIWQYAISAKKGKSLMVQGSGSFQGESSADMTMSSDDEHSNKKYFQDKDKHSSSSSGTNERNPKRDYKRKGGKGRDDEDNCHPRRAAPKKAKVVWTNSLHNRFLQALRHIGLDKAVPKKILQFMSVPGLTRENVASHLQKYRMFLRRVAEKTACATQPLNEKTLRSSFAYGHQFPLFGAAREYSQFLMEEERRRTLAGFIGQVSSLPTTNFCANYFSPLASSSNPPPQFAYGQSQQLNNPYDRGSIFGNTSYPTNYGNMLGQGSTDVRSAAFGLMCPTNHRVNSQQTFPQPQAGTDLLNMGSSWIYNNNNGIEATHNFVAPDLFSTNNNNVGVRINGNGGLVGMGEMDFSHHSDILNGARNGNKSFPAPESQGFRFDHVGVVDDDNDFDIMNDDSFAFDNMLNLHQMGRLSLEETFLDQISHKEDEFLHPNFASSSSYARENPSMDQFLNFISTPCDEGDASWGSQVLRQQESRGQVTSSMQNGMNPIMSNDTPSYGNQPISNQEWEDELLESLFGSDS